MHIRFRLSPWTWINALRVCTRVCYLFKFYEFNDNQQQLQNNSGNVRATAFAAFCYMLLSSRIILFTYGVRSGRYVRWVEYIWYSVSTAKAQKHTSRHAHMCTVSWVWTQNLDIWIHLMRKRRQTESRKKKVEREKNARQSRHRSLTQWNFGNKLASATINTHGYGFDDDVDWIGDRKKKLISLLQRKKKCFTAYIFELSG